MSFDLSTALPYFSPALSPEDTAPLHAYGSVDAPITRMFSKSIIVTYVLDEPGARVYVRERDVEERHREDLHLCAIDNLRRHVSKKRVRFEPRGATHCAKLDGQHDAALLLLDELWDARSEGLVAAVPARGTLVFTETGDGLAQLRTHLASTSLSAELFVRRDRKWQLFS